MNIGGTHWGAPTTYFHPFRGPSGQARELRYVPGLGVGHAGEYLTDRLTDEALRLIDEAGDRPFFLNRVVPQPAHPDRGEAGADGVFPTEADSGMWHRNTGYAAMIHSLDENVGRVLARLEARRLADRTLVVFMSDNGGVHEPVSGAAGDGQFAAPVGEGFVVREGIRSPTMRLPGVTAAGGVCEEPVFCTDPFPTIAELTGAEARTAVDGVSLVPLLRDPKARLGRGCPVLPLPALLHDHDAGRGDSGGGLEGVFRGWEEGAVRPADRSGGTGEPGGTRTGTGGDVGGAVGRVATGRESGDAHANGLCGDRPGDGRMEGRCSVRAGSWKRAWAVATTAAVALRNGRMPPAAERRGFAGSRSRRRTE